MNAIPDQSALTPAPFCWDAIYKAVNVWRGECMHHFSVIEQDVTQTLLALDKAKPQGTSVRLRHLIGQRYEDLAAAIGQDGPFADVGKKASASLAHYRERHEAFRTQLCHGRWKISVTREGLWVAVARNLSIRGHKAETATDVIEQQDAEARLAALKTDCQRLSSYLRHLQTVVETQGPSPAPITATSATS